MLGQGLSACQAMFTRAKLTWSIAERQGALHALQEVEKDVPALSPTGQSEPRVAFKPISKRYVCKAVDVWQLQTVLQWLHQFVTRREMIHDVGVRQISSTIHSVQPDVSVSACRKKLSASLSTASALVASHPANSQATDKPALLLTTAPVQHSMPTQHEQPARPSEMQELRHEVLTLRQMVEDLRDELRASRGVTEPEVMVSCPLCLEDVSSISAITLEACQHSYCRPCLSKHLQHQVQHKRHVPSMLQCPQLGGVHLYILSGAM